LLGIAVVIREQFVDRMLPLGRIVAGDETSAAFPELAEDR